MKMTLAAIATSLTLLAGCNHLELKSIVLYDGALGNGNIPPEQQGWLVFGGKANSPNPPLSPSPPPHIFEVELGEISALLYFFVTSNPELLPLWL